MKLLIQRVVEASVSVNNQTVSSIGKGLLVLLGIHINDDKALAKKFAQKLPKIRLWPGKAKEEQQQQEEPEESKDAESNEKPWSSSVADNGYEIIVVSQFTLYNTMKGTKPDFHLAKNAQEARVTHLSLNFQELYEYFMDELKKCYIPEKVQGGVFQEYMKVALVNDGPVTIEIDELNKEEANKQQQKKQKS